MKSIRAARFNVIRFGEASIVLGVSMRSVEFVGFELRPIRRKWRSSSQLRAAPRLVEFARNPDLENDGRRVHPQNSTIQSNVRQARTVAKWQEESVSPWERRKCDISHVSPPSS